MVTNHESSKREGDQGVWASKEHCSRKKKKSIKNKNGEAKALRSSKYADGVVQRRGITERL